MKHTTVKQLTDFPLKKNSLLSSISTLALLSLPILSTVPLTSATAAEIHLGVAGASGSKGEQGIAGLPGSGRSNTAAPGANETQTIDQMTGRHTITLGGKGGNGGDGANAGQSGEAENGSHGGNGGNGYDGKNGGTSGAVGSNGNSGSAAGLATNGNSGTSGTQGGDGSSGQAGGSGTLDVEGGDASFDSVTLGAHGGEGGMAGQASAGTAGGNGGTGGTGGKAGDGGDGGAGSNSDADDRGGNGGRGGDGAAGAAGGIGANGSSGSPGGKGAQAAAGGNAKLTLNNGNFSANTMTLGGTGGQAGAASNGSAGGKGGDGGSAGSQGQDGSRGENGSDGLASIGGWGGQGGTGGAAGRGGKGGDGGAGAKGSEGGKGAQGGHAELNLNNADLTIQNTLQVGGAGGQGSRGGDGGETGTNGTTSSGIGGTGGIGGNGGAGATGGDGGNATFNVKTSNLSVNSVTLGADGAIGGAGGNGASDAIGGLGGAGGHGGSGTLNVEDSHIDNSGFLQLGGNGHLAGSNAGATLGGKGGNGGNGSALFKNSSGQIASGILLGGKDGGQDTESGLAGSGHLTIESGNYTADSLTIGKADTRYGSENQYLQTGGIFTTDDTGLYSGALSVNGGMFASSHLDASQGQLDVMDKGTAIIGTRELNAERWQQGAGWMARQQPAPFAGTLAIAAGETVDFSSPDLHWSIGSDNHLNRFDDASLTIVSAKPYVDQGSSALLIGNGSVAPDAKMLVIADDNLKTGEHFIASEGGNTADSFWQHKNITSSSRLFKMGISQEGNTHHLTAEQTTQPLLPQDTQDLMANMAKTQGVNTNSDDAGQRFISQAMDIRYISEEVLASKLVQSALHIASVVGVQHTTFMALSAAGHAVERHLSGVASVQGSEAATGVNLWATLLSDNSSSRGFSSGRWQARSSANLGGLALGSDYRFDVGDVGMMTSGLALNTGGGKSTSHGNVSPTRNDFNFWGSSLYSSWQQGALNVMADVSYTGSRNRIKQQSSAEIDGGSLRAKMNSRALSSGIRASYQWNNELADVTPHVGIRYTRLKSESFATHNELGRMFDTAGDSQKIWSFPLGISLSKTFTTKAGYQIKPLLDMTWTGNSGDVRAKSRSWLPGEEARYSMTDSSITDHSVFTGNIGVELSHNQLSYSLYYQLNESSHITDNNVHAGVRFAF